MCARVVKTSMRRGGLRTLALLWGALVLLGHVTTYGQYVRQLDLPPDLIQHLIGVGLFSLLYRASWRPLAGDMLGPTLASLFVCCGWGALCESLQLLVPVRDFQWRELALNTATPAVLIGLWSAVEALWER
jgi:VanZ family protein